MAKQQRRPDRRRSPKCSIWSKLELGLRAFTSVVVLIKALWGL